MWCGDRAYVRLQNLPGYKTGLVSRQVLHLLSKLQNWICPKTGQYKICLVSNTKIEASIRATKPKPWQSHLTSETVEIFIQNEKAGLVPMQSRFWCGRLSVGTKPVLVQAQSRFWSGWFRVGTKPVLVQQVTKPVLYQDRFCTFYRSYRTGFVPKRANIYIYNINIYIIYNICKCIRLFIEIYPFWDKSSFVASIEDAKPVLIQNRFCNLPYPNRLCACSKTGFVPTLNQPLQNRLCACSKNRLCADPKPTARKPALCLLENRLCAALN